MVPSKRTSNLAKAATICVYDWWNGRCTRQVEDHWFRRPGRVNAVQWMVRAVRVLPGCYAWRGQGKSSFFPPLSNRLWCSASLLPRTSVVLFSEVMLPTCEVVSYKKISTKLSTQLAQKEFKAHSILIESYRIYPEKSALIVVSLIVTCRCISLPQALKLWNRTSLINLHRKANPKLLYPSNV